MLDWLHPVSAEFEYIEANLQATVKQLSRITCSVSPSSMTIRGLVTISGLIDPPIFIVNRAATANTLDLLKDTL
jgi:hypothetical protein